MHDRLLLTGGVDGLVRRAKSDEDAFGSLTGPGDRFFHRVKIGFFAAIAVFARCLPEWITRPATTARPRRIDLEWILVVAINEDRGTSEA